MSFYDYGNKNEWRKNMWELFHIKLSHGYRHRLFDKRKNISIFDREESVLLYLPGPDDLDRKHALDIGYHPENIIGVERDYKIVKKLRKKGVNVIHGDIADVLLNWSGLKIDGIICDFMGGICETLIKLTFTYPIWTDINDPCVFVINLLRGRDKFKKRTINFLKKNKVVNIMDYTKKTKIRHRGKSFIKMMEIATEYITQNSNNTTSYYPSFNNFILSYETNKTPRHVYDSAIINIGRIRKNMEEKYSYVELLRILGNSGILSYTDASVRGKINAALAVRTKKIRKMERP